jgi:uncharacterized protein (DUF58 family)
VTRFPSPKLGAYAGLTALGLAAALALSRPEPALLTAPFALVLAVGLAGARRPRVRVRVEVEQERVVEGDEVGVTLRLTAAETLERVEILVALPHALEVADGSNPVALRLRGGEEETRDLRLHCARWGGYAVGDVYVRVRDPFGLFVYEERFDLREALKVYPRPQELRRLVPPAATQPFTGNQVSRGKGEGIEFADLRAYASGDRVRRINWRASARRGALWVNEHHPERNTDVILFLDSFTEAREADRSTLDAAVRAAASLAARYLDRKDRVGLVSFGGVLKWLLPATGLVQRYRIVDSLIDTEITFSYAWKDVDVIPPRTLPPQALVLAVTPLLDDRAVAALLDLRARGRDLAVIEVSPVPFAPPDEGEHERLAHRIWELRREALRAEYQQLGVPVVEWRDDLPLAAALEEVGAFRRYAGASRA